MFKKRSKAKSSAAAPRKQLSVQQSEGIATRNNGATIPRTQYGRTKLTANELQQQFATVDIQAEINDDWEDEQLRKNGVQVVKTSHVNENDPFGSIKERIRERIQVLERLLDDPN